MKVTLTFDNGPDPSATQFVLRELRARNIKSTFFLMGHKLAARGGLDIAREIHAEGHWLGNHTFSHDVPLGLDARPGHEDTEIGATQRLLGELAHPDRFFRPHGKGALGPHLVSRQVLEYLKAQRYTLLILHEMYLQDMRETLLRFLDQLQAQGCDFEQEFPDDCIPLHSGCLRRDISGWVSGN